MPIVLGSPSKSPCLAFRFLPLTPPPWPLGCFSGTLVSTNSCACSSRISSALSVSLGISELCIRCSVQLLLYNLELFLIEDFWRYAEIRVSFPRGSSVLASLVCQGSTSVLQLLRLVRLFIGLHVLPPSGLSYMMNHSPSSGSLRGFFGWGSVHRPER
jgi:hypothetical protein